MQRLRVVSDVHGKYELMDQLNLHDKYVVQLGDMGFNYQHLYENYDPNLLKVCLGNHDAYNNRPIGFDLGDYGSAKLGPFKFWFVRGEFSIDCKIRADYELRGIWPKTWFDNEQLNENERQSCLREYGMTKPRVVMSHGCPIFIKEKISNPDIMRSFGWPEDMNSVTQQLLQDMWDVHQPELFIFGHFHRDWYHVEGNTTFICMKELGYLDFDEDWRIL